MRRGSEKVKIDHRPMPGGVVGDFAEIREEISMLDAPKKNGLVFGAGGSDVTTLVDSETEDLVLVDGDTGCG